MNVQIDKLVKSLLQRDSLEQCSLQELEQYADRHPYFGAAQLLLTKKLQQENPSRYDEQLQKTFLFFHNPLWVEHLLNETGNAEIILPEKNEEKIPEPPTIEQVAVPLIPAIEKESPTVQVTVLKATEAEPVSVSLEEKKEMLPAAALPVNQAEISIRQPVESPKEELIFEPFHTVDYFASQGIKFREEEKPADKFGQQLRSFTDWLKTMKRLPVAEMAKNVAVVAEKKVEILAEHSLEGAEVLTETMAEVWEKQGNKEKAIEIYSKLSLLDPPKSHYFAAKIEVLKKIN